ncbi:MAG: hypothetical protein AAF846_29570 [Chloroflexota bacterium]
MRRLVSCIILFFAFSSVQAQSSTDIENSPVISENNVDELIVLQQYDIDVFINNIYWNDNQELIIETTEQVLMLDLEAQQVVNTPSLLENIYPLESNVNLNYDSEGYITEQTIEIFTDTQIVRHEIDVALESG